MSSLYRTFGKRFLDLVLGGIALLLALPLLTLTALLVRLRLGTPVLFRQERPGRDGRLFTLLKFRTMTDERDEDGQLLSDEERLTGLGKKLRRWSLDELPELVNVLLGDLSLVGPRPLLPRYLERYTTLQARRHEVLPGITGWAQVHGRNQVAWSERLALDVWYVDHLGLCLDIRILGRTALQILTGRGISAAGHATMPEFRGDGGRGD